MDILRDENDDKPLLIVSGWSDGAVRRYHLDDVPVDSHQSLVLQPSLENDYPRTVVFVDPSTMLVHMNSGQLLRVDAFQDRAAVSLFYDGRNTFKNGYAKMAVAKDGEKFIAVGSLQGQVMVFDSLGTQITQFQIDCNKNNKILQILWLNQTLASKLLVCIPDGIMVS